MMDYMALSNKITNMYHTKSTSFAVCDGKYDYNIIYYNKHNICNIINNISVCKIEKDSKNTCVYYGSVDNCIAYIERTPKKENIIFHTKFHCEITKDKYEKYIKNNKDRQDNSYKKQLQNNIMQMTNYFKNIDSDNYDLFIKKYTINTHDINILPYFSYYPINKDFIQEYKKYIHCESKTRLFNLITKLKFILYIFSDKIHNIFELDVHFLKNIKAIIKNFLSKILYYDITHDDIRCYVMQHNHYVYCIFYLINSAIDWRYISYYNQYITSLDINDLIHKLENNFTVSYYDIFYIKNNENNKTATNVNNISVIQNKDIIKANPYCQGDVLYDLYKELPYKKRENNIIFLHLENKNTIYLKKSLANTTLEIELNNLNENITFDNKYIVCNNNKINNDTINLELHSFYYKILYYMDSSMANIMMKDKNKNDYYNVITHNITSKIVQLNENFRNKLYESIKKSCNEEPIFKINDNDIFMCKLPLYTGLKIEKISDNNIYTKSITIIETPELYNKYVKIPNNEISKNKTINVILLVSQIIINMTKHLLIENVYYPNIKIENYNKKLYDIIKNNQVLLQIINSPIMIHENFVIRQKQPNNIDAYTLWYLGNFKINDTHNTIDILLTIISKMNNILIKTTEEIMLNNKEMDNIKIKNSIFMNYTKNMTIDNDLQKYLIKNTNFTEIFQDNQFIHNIRYLNNKNRKIINDAINIFLKSVYTYKIKRATNYSFINYNKYYTYVHYPNTYYYDVFHLHIVSTKESSTLYSPYTPVYDPDVYTRVIDTEFMRVFQWNNIRYVNVKNIKLNYRVTKKDDADNKIKNELNILKDTHFMKSLNRSNLINGLYKENYENNLHETLSYDIDKIISIKNIYNL
jgi:hypothetical protein